MSVFSASLFFWGCWEACREQTERRNWSEGAADKRFSCVSLSDNNDNSCCRLGTLDGRSERDHYGRSALSTTLGCRLSLCQLQRTVSSLMIIRCSFTWSHDITPFQTKLFYSRRGQRLGHCQDELAASQIQHGTWPSSPPITARQHPLISTVAASVHPFCLNAWMSRTTPETCCAVSANLTDIMWATCRRQWT